MRRFLACCLVVLIVGVIVPAGCGGGSGIEEGIPKNLDAAPKSFDPGGDTVPDMKGARPKAK